MRRSPSPRPSPGGRGRAVPAATKCSPFSDSSQRGRSEFPLLGRNDSDGLGGTANLAVLGGNLPPSLEHHRRSPFGAAIRSESGGLVARRHGQVARATAYCFDLHPRTVVPTTRASSDAPEAG